jgi:tetratricopeptide (TPR) repeat protein
MSKTLNLIDLLLARGRAQHDIGRTYDALQTLGRLTRLQELPQEVAEEAQDRLAEIQMHHRQYGRARRHLTAALAHSPNDAGYLYRMGSALDLDEQSDPEAALHHYRQSLQADPDQPRCLSDFGLLALCLGNDEEGLQALQRAVELAPDDPEILSKLLEGLCEVGQAEEARRLLRVALFRNGRHSGFRKLRSDFEFQQLREAQEAARQPGQDARPGPDGPILLPFAPTTTTTEPKRSGRKRIRRDGPAAPPPPHVPRPGCLPDRKHA